MLRISPLKAMAMGLAAAVASWSGSAHAQAATCGISGSSSASPAFYDPFNPTGLAATSITLNLTRVNGAGGQKTDIVNFYLRSPDSSANGIQIIPRTALIVGSVIGFNQNIFYNNPGPVPIVAPTSLNPISPNNFLKMEFTGNNAASDTAQVVFDVIFPANLNLNASTNLAFDAIFACSTTGGGPGTQQVGSLPNAVVFPVTVLSALQASFVGTTGGLDFGEVGALNLAQAQTKNTGTGNYVSVRSSGPYSVTLSSANAFQVKHPMGSGATELVKYQLRFLGVDRNNGTTPVGGATALTQNCLRAGVPASDADKMYLRATLDEATIGKTPSASYSDQLTVTITPLAAVPAVPAGAISCDIAIL